MKKRTFILAACSTALIMSLAGCGGGGGGGAQPAGVSIPPQSAPSVNSVTVREDTYGLQNTTFLTSSQGNGSLVLRAAIASSVNDPGFRTLFRIDISAPSAVAAAGTYRVGNGTGLLPFPGEILFFNGHQSTLLQTIGGTITFTSYGRNAGDLIAGNFTVTIADGYSLLSPAPAYTISADFRFVLASSETVSPAPSPVPAGSLSAYSAKCGSCHALGSHDLVAESAPDLSHKGGLMEEKFSPDVSGHQGITLAANEIRGLRVLFNAP